MSERTPLIAAATVLFTGKIPRSKLQFDSSKVSAVATGGICVYIDALRKPNLDSECISRVHIIPGRIENDGKQYARIQDHGNTTDWYDKYDIKDFSAIFQQVHQITEARAKTRQTAQTLHLSFELPGPSRYSLPEIGPRNLSFWARHATGLLKCQGHDQDRTQILGIDFKQPFQTFSWSNKEVWLCIGTTAACCMAISFLHSTKRPLLLVNDVDCLECCLDLIQIDLAKEVRGGNWTSENISRVAVLWVTA